MIDPRMSNGSAWSRELVARTQKEASRTLWERGIFNEGGVLASIPIVMAMGERTQRTIRKSPTGLATSVVTS
jgi:hypothetical protein